MHKKERDKVPLFSFYVLKFSYYSITDILKDGAENNVGKISLLLLDIDSVISYENNKYVVLTKSEGVIILNFTKGMETLSANLLNREQDQVTVCGRITSMEDTVRLNVIDVKTD